jgi:hypothetical protein
MACTHSNTKKINDLRVCLNCGLTLTNDGKVIFDRKLPNYKPKKRRKTNGKK